MVQAMSVERLKDEHVTCRTYGHAWRPYNVVRTLNSRGRPIEFRAHLLCDRCKARREQRLDGEGNIVGNSYRYAEGYEKRRDEAPMTRADARHEYLRRITPYDVVEEDE